MNADFWLGDCQRCRRMGLRRFWFEGMFGWGILTSFEGGDSADGMRSVFARMIFNGGTFHPSGLPNLTNQKSALSILRHVPRIIRAKTFRIPSAGSNPSAPLSITLKQKSAQFHPMAPLTITQPKICVHLRPDLRQSARTPSFPATNSLPNPTNHRRSLNNRASSNTRSRR
jgi:hypothetical protein